MSRFTAITTPSVTASATTSTIPPTITIFSTSWNCNLTGSSTLLSTAKLSRFRSLVTVIQPVRDVCARGYLCGEVRLKDDITGIGVIVAFFVTAWAALIFLIMAYWLGLLPDQLLRPVDRQLFRANSRRCHSEWKQTLDNVTLLFSDQQLLTGIGIMLAGYYEVFARDLDALHWHTVTYLAWMSSTVHLITLSLLRDRLNANKTMRNFRLAAMLTLLSLLIVALAPSASLFYVETARMLPRYENFYNLYRSPFGGAAIPAKCFYGIGYTADWQPYQGISPAETIGSQVAPAAIISYITLVGSYVWKISQLLESSLKWWRTTIRHMPEARLELVAKRALTKHQRPTWYDMCFYYVTKSAYIVFCMVSDVLDSFATTNVVLFFALSWGTLQVILPRIWLSLATKRPGQDSEELSFGQILPLMLLLQPVAGIVAHFLGKSAVAPNTRHPSATYQSLLPFRPSAYSTLADAFRNGQLLTAKEKALGHYDPIKQHLLESKAYRGLLWSFLIVSYCLVIVLETLALLIGLTFGAEEFVLFLWLTCCCWLAWIPFSVMFYSLFSNKLR